MRTAAAGVHVSYGIKLGGEAMADLHGRANWKFYVPAKMDPPLIAYASCNGFSSAKLARDTDEPYALWKRMAVQHATKPFALLLMGGDQVYADVLLKRMGIHVLLLRNLRYFLLMNTALFQGFFKFLKGIRSNVWEPTKRH